jgi:DNA-binding transcriptional LysR family regulator
MNVSYRQLKAFILIARLGNFSRAAERLHITQSGLSAMMRELEGNVKIRLFDRTTRAVALTEAGERLLPAAVTAVGALDDALADIGGIGARAQLSLKVAATPLVSSSLLPAVCGALKRTRPDLAIDLTDCDLHRALALVESGDADFGLGFFFRAAKGIERTLLHTFHLMRVARVEDGDPVPAGTGRAQWAELKDVPLIGLPADNPIQQLVEVQLRKFHVDAGERTSFNNFDTLIAMVAAGMGTAVIPTFALLACGRYRVRCDVLANPIVPVGFYRIVRKGREPAPAMDDFTAALLALLAGLDGGVSVSD